MSSSREIKLFKFKFSFIAKMSNDLDGRRMTRG